MTPARVSSPEIVPLVDVVLTGMDVTGRAITDGEDQDGSDVELLPAPTANRPVNRNDAALTVRVQVMQLCLERPVRLRGKSTIELQDRLPSLVFTRHRTRHGLILGGIFSDHYGQGFHIAGRERLIPAADQRYIRMLDHR